MVRLARILVSAFAISSSATSLAVDVKVNSDAAGDVQNEPRISVDPTNSLNLVTAYNDRVGTSNSLGISYSNDGGATWTDTQIGLGLVHPTTATTLDDVFDPYIEHDPSGTVYAGYVARPRTPTLPGPGAESVLAIEFSTDGGATWSGPTVIAADLNGSGPSYRFNDRPTMAATATDVAVTWLKDVDVGMPTSDIYYSHSPLAPVPGLSFSAPVTVNDLPNGIDRANAPDVAVAANGTVYVAWIDVDVTMADEPTATIMIDSSPTLTTPTFGADLPVRTIDPLPKHVSSTAGLGRTADDARGQSYPVIATEPTDALGNTVYLAYAEDQGTADEGDIFFIKSTDGGGSWSTPLLINDDGGLTDQMHPAIVVKPDGSAIDLIWYDKRNSPTDDAWDVYASRSTDGGVTWSTNVRISDNTFATPTNSLGTEPWMGEYLGIDADNVNAFIAFTSSVNPSGPNDGFGDIYFDTFLNADPDPDPSPTAPEPSALVLLMLAALSLGMRRSTRRNSL